MAKRVHGLRRRAPKRDWGALSSDVSERLAQSVPEGNIMLGYIASSVEHVIRRLEAELRIAHKQRNYLAEGVVRAAAVSGELDLPVVCEIQRWWREDIELNKEAWATAKR